MNLTSEERDRAMGLEREVPRPNPFRDPAGWHRSFEDDTPTVTTPRERGQGLVYHGTHVFLHGFVVTSMTDCTCPPCARLDPWDDRRRVNATVQGDFGPVPLEHARTTSFRKPTTTEETHP